MNFFDLFDSKTAAADIKIKKQEHCCSCLSKF